ncbi:putative Zn-dependent protease [Nocardioides thalensis]|uniref:Putative Zn-dependent protease n=1 Tax=Nocardioides thalensis TaxID=1914755 RepID=A0A853C3H6_9ACTN|nr:tetratricopeptide repeat protein [Nocardioides thalensis]NYJ01849.1 putative Zn-dependent protease [Nocardioides thalensis]
MEEEQLKAPAIVFPRGEERLESAFRTAHDLLSRRAPKEALEVIEPALEAEPGNRSLRVMRAWAYYMRAQLGKAVDELTELVDEDPSDTWARHTLGRALERQSRHREALPHLRLAAAMSGDVEHEVDVLRVERVVEGL